MKRDANANVVLNNLYKHTPMQSSFAINMVALVDGVPRTLNLASLLTAYVAHQVDVITRRSEFRLRKARDRAHIVEGLLRALDAIDAIIALIRGSEDRGAAREGLMAAPFEFSDVQANHILDLTLGRLTRLARHELEDEMAQLRETIAELEAILADDAKLRGVIKTELAEIREAHATPRVARITHDPGEMNVEDLLDDKDLLVIMTRAGYIKTVEADAFRTQGRGGRGVAGGKLKEEDLVKRILHTSAHAYLLFFSNRGRVYRLRAHEIPERDRTAKGIPIVNLLPLTPDEHIEAVIDTRDYETNRYLFFATKLGQVKKTLMSEYDKSRREGFIAINLREDDELVQVIQTNGTEDVMIVSRKGMAIRFANDDEQVRPMGRDAAGVRGMRLKAGDEVVACDVAHDDAVMLIVTDAGFGKRTRISEFNQQGRGGQGVRAIKLASTRGTVQAAYMVSNPDDEVMVISSVGRDDPPRDRHHRSRAARPRCHGREGRQPRRGSDRRIGRARPPAARSRLTCFATSPEPKWEGEATCGCADEMRWASQCDARVREAPIVERSEQEPIEAQRRAATKKRSRIVERSEQEPIEAERRAATRKGVK